MTLKGASFFTGAGGFDLGFEKAGIEIVFQCEKDKYCNQLLEEKYPNVRRSEDISLLHPKAIPQADIYFGGFPCQNASVAGDRKGLAGSKTGLFFDFVRIIKANKPQWICLENVPGLLSSNGKRDFKSVIEALAQCGYYVSWRVLDSQHFGVPQRRRRLFIVGCLGDWRNPFEVLFDQEFTPKNAVKSRKNESGIAPEIGSSTISVEASFLSGNDRNLHFWKQITGTLCANKKSITVLDSSDRLRFPTPVECERLQGFPDKWTEAFSDSQRYKMTGNAVSVPVAEFIGQRIKNVHQRFINNHIIKGAIAS